MVEGGSRTANLAFIARNYVGFRKVSIRGNWERDHEPDVQVDSSDATGICVNLSVDAFVQWEDMVRGIPLTRICGC